MHDPLTVALEVKWPWFWMNPDRPPVWYPQGSRADLSVRVDRPTSPTTFRQAERILHPEFFAIAGYPAEEFQAYL